MVTAPVFVAWMNTLNREDDPDGLIAASLDDGQDPVSAKRSTQELSGDHSVFRNGVCVTCYPVQARAFNPAEPRVPGGEHGGEWTSGGAVGHALKDVLQLAGRIDLGKDERLLGSDRLNLDGDNDVLFAVVDSPRGRDLRLGVIPLDAVDRWKAADKGATVRLKPRDVTRLRNDLDEADAAGRKAAKAADKAWNAGGPPTDPKLLGTDAVAEGSIGTDWGTLRYDTYVTDGDPGSYVTSLRVGEGIDEFAAELDPKALRRLVRKLDTLTAPA